MGTTESGMVMHALPNRCEKAWGKPVDEVTVRWGNPITGESLTTPVQERDIDLALGMQIWPNTECGFDETQGEEGQGELWIKVTDPGFVECSNSVVNFKSDQSLGSRTRDWQTTVTYGAPVISLAARSLSTTPDSLARSGSITRAKTT